MILVTGGAGFIGSNLLRGLNARGRRDLWVMDRLGQGDQFTNLSGADYADFFAIEELDSLLATQGSQIEAVFHQGACSATTERDADYLFQNNYRFSQKLYRFCQQAQIPFLYASSASVYGNGEKGFVENRTCEEPLNAYAWSKFQFDRWVRLQESTRTAPVVGMRYFNVYGPQENHKGRMASVIWQFHQQAKKEGVIRLFEGSETFLRDFIHVDDVVRTNLHAWDTGYSGIVNVGTGAARSFMDIAQIMLTERPGCTLEMVPFPADLEGKYQKYTQADTSRLRNELGLTGDFISLEEGVRHYAQILAQSEGLLPHPERV